MIVNMAIGALIFGYAGWSLVKYIKRSRKGKCAACEMNKHCTVSCDTPPSPVAKR